MSDDQFSLIFARFAASPNGKTALELLQCCRKLIIGQAISWRAKDLSFGDKVKEIMSEMLLILLEDFSSQRMEHPKSILKFLKLKIRRLTRPSQRREFSFGAAEDLPESGRCNFSACKLALVDEIHATIRRCLLHQFDQQLGLLEFLFIHIYPEINWASRLISQRTGEIPEKRLFSDKKRHNSFNQLIKKELQSLQNGEMHEIVNWSGGERSHLAWRIINISPAEIDCGVNDALEHLEDWRENIDRRQPQLLSNLLIAERVYSSMRTSISDRHKLRLAAEDVEPYGETEDLLLKLIGKRFVTTAAEETEQNWQAAQAAGSSDLENIFNQVAIDVCDWFEPLAKDLSNRLTSKNEQSVVKY